jgi:hypothetical protein
MAGNQDAGDTTDVNFTGMIRRSLRRKKKQDSSPSNNNDIHSSNHNDSEAADGAPRINTKVRSPSPSPMTPSAWYKKNCDHQELFAYNMRHR